MRSAIRVSLIFSFEIADFQAVGEGEANEEYHRGPRPLGFLPQLGKRGQGGKHHQS